LLKAAGAKDLTIEFKTSADREISSIVAIIKEQWESIGVKVNVRPYEFATYFADVQKGNFEICSMRWTAIVEPDHLYKIFHSGEFPPSKNRGFYKNAKLDAILKEARFSQNFEHRKRLYNRAQEIIANDRPYISLWYPDNIVVASHALADFNPHPLGSWMNLLFARKE
jgi:peptide/nickel transport system substrate-binding protein